MNNVIILCFLKFKFKVQQLKKKHRKQDCYCNHKITKYCHWFRFEGTKLCLYSKHLKFLLYFKISCQINVKKNSKWLNKSNDIGIDTIAISRSVAKSFIQTAPLILKNNNFCLLTRCAYISIGSKKKKLFFYLKTSAIE